MAISTYQLTVTLNDPFGSSFMDATAGATYLVTELQTLKADIRGQSLNKTWISLVGLQGVWTGSLAWTVISGTQASIQGDQTVATGTGYIIVGNRVKAFVTAGTIYGTITAATAGGGVTTVTVAWDAGAAFDAGLTDAQLGVDLSKIISTAPQNYAVITNTAAAWAGNINPAILAYVQGAEYRVKWSGAASQGTDTIALNGLAAITVKKLFGGALVNLAAGDLASGDITNLVYDSTGPTMVLQQSPVVDATTLGFLLQKRAYKATDQTVTSSTTLVNDSALSFAVAANETWQFEVDLYATFDSGAASGIKVAFTVPSGATLQWAALNGTNPAVPVTASGTGSAVAVGGGVGPGSSTAIITKIIGQVINGATPGTAQLQWAQNTSDGTATAMKAGSSLIATRLTP